jgi:hypothetical protein
MEWRWSGVNVKTSGGGGMNDLIMELKWSWRKCLWRWSGEGLSKLGYCDSYEFS